MRGKVLLVSIACLAGPALAADDQEPAPPPATRGGLEEVVVTATRREERLQDVPVAVTAVTSRALAVADLATTRNLTQIVPGFFGARNMGAYQPVIRGVGSAGVGVGDESNVATYIDGVYYPESGANWVELVEVERVEVLRGPQGTIFGRNATGGLVNIITPDPSFTSRGHISARFGRMRNDANEYEVRGYLTTAITDKVAWDFAGLGRKTEGYIDDLVRGGGVGDQRVVHLRSKLLFEPGDRARIVLTGEFFDQASQSNAPQPFHGNTAGRRYPGVIIPTKPWQTALDILPVLDIQRYNFALRTRFEFDAFNLETTTGYQYWDSLKQNTDADASNIFLGSLPALYNSESISQEVRLLSAKSGPLQWLVGGYFFDLNGTIDLSLVSGAPDRPTTTIALFPETWTRSYAGFAEGTYEFTDSWFLTLGGRYTWEKRKFSQKVAGRDLFGIVDKSFDKFDWRAVLRYNFADDANVYASYGTAFKSGVFNAAGTSPTPVNPEEIKAAEFGIKADPLDWLRTNFAGYYYTYDNLQVVAKAATGPGFILQNAGSAEIYGAELEVNASVNQDLNLRGTVAWNHANYDKFPAAQSFIPRPDGGNIVTALDASGNQMTRAPRWTFTVGGDWGHDLAGGRFTIAANLYHSSKVYWDFQNVFAQPAYTMLSGQMAWSTADELWRVTLGMTNITNAAVAQQIRPGELGADVFYEQPRKVTLGLERRF